MEPTVKVEVTTPFRKPYAVNVESLFEGELDGNDYGVGQIEAATATAANNSKALGRLVDVLLQRGALQPQDITTILGLYETEVRAL